MRASALVRGRPPSELKQQAGRNRKEGGWARLGRQWAVWEGKKEKKRKDLGLLG